MKKPAASSLMNVSIITILVTCCVHGAISVTTTASSVQTNNSVSDWPLDYVIELEGDITIGGSFPIHGRSEEYQCGEIQDQSGFQPLETMLYALDELNNGTGGILPAGVTLGAYIIDSCDSDAYGLTQMVDFIRGSIAVLDEADSSGDADNSTECDCTSDWEVITGVVGASSSVVSTQLANLLRLFEIPQVSYWSTSPDFTNSDRYPYFFRTVPSDAFQSQAIVALLRSMGWSYFSVVYEESTYGSDIRDALDDAVGETDDMCIATSEKIPRDSGYATDEDYENIINNLIDVWDRAKVVVLLMIEQEATELFTAIATRFSEVPDFVWIGSDGWSGRTLPVESREEYVEGAITIQPLSYTLPDFDSYFTGLNPLNYSRNPWFIEYWEFMFECRYPGSVNNYWNIEYSEECDEDLSLAQDSEYEQSPVLQFVYDAVYVFAYAIRDMHTDQCGSDYVGLCSNMTPVDGEVLKSFMQNVSFTSINDLKMSFPYDNGDGPARYKIMHFRKTQNNTYEWVDIGTYIDEIDLNMTALQFRTDSDFPASYCSDECKPGFRMAMETGSNCCWKCIECKDYQYLVNATTCMYCDDGTEPNENLDGCDPIPEDYLEFTDMISIAIAPFSMMGIILSISIMIIFAMNQNTPIVMASARELSFILLIGVVSLFTMSLILTLKPTNLLCVVINCGVGMSYTMCFAALLTKTNRIWRIFTNAKSANKQLICISPSSQFLIVFMVISPQIAINIVWQVLNPTKVVNYYPSREANQLICFGATDATYFIGLAYPGFLIMLCTFFAIQTRTIPAGFNEAKFIAFTMYTVCVIWLSFIPLYLLSSADVYVRTATLSVSMIANGMVILFNLFGPKLYIILLHPEKNTRDAFAPKMRKKTKNDNSLNVSQEAAAPAVATKTADVDLKEKQAVPSANGNENMAFEQDAL